MSTPFVFKKHFFRFIRRKTEPGDEMEGNFNCLLEFKVTVLRVPPWTVPKINTITKAIIIHPTKELFIIFIHTSDAKSYENSAEL